MCELSDTPSSQSAATRSRSLRSSRRARRGAIRRYGFSARAADAPAGSAAGEVKKDKKDKDKEEMIPDQTQTEVIRAVPSVGCLALRAARLGGRRGCDPTLQLRHAATPSPRAALTWRLSAHEQCDLVAPFNMQVGAGAAAKKTPGG